MEQSQLRQRLPKGHDGRGWNFKLDPHQQEICKPSKRKTSGQVTKKSNNNKNKKNKKKIENLKFKIT